MRGLAIGVGMLIVGFEFEYADTPDDPTAAAPSLRTGSGNILLQTPTAFFGIQPYLTGGAGLYRETLGTHEDTSFALNTGGGVKVSLVGPLRLRIDYRVFKLGGGALASPAHRDLRRTEPEVLSYLPKSDTSARLTKFCPEAYASAYCLKSACTSVGNASARIVDTV